jgi:hypothetical protein
VKCDRPICGQTLGLLGAGWFLLALYVGETELLCFLPPIAPQAMILGLAALLTGTYFGSAAFRTTINSWGYRPLVALHLVRFVGIYFLWLSGHGELDRRFAVPAGWGDIIVATGAGALLVLPAARWSLVLWNSIGLADILFVVVNAAILRFHNPEVLQPFTELPLSFLPTMVVPLIIATHVILFARLSRSAIGKSQTHSDFPSCHLTSTNE